MLPGIVATFLVTQSRAPLPVIIGAATFAIICVLGIEWLASTELVNNDAAIGLVFPALFGLGVLGIQRYAENVHLDLDSTIYGEIAFSPFRIMQVGPVTAPRSVVTIGVIAVINLLLVAVLWKELKVTSFDPEFARTIRVPPRLVSRVLLVATAITAVSAFESVGAILVVTMLIVPAAAAYLLTDKLVVMVGLAVGIGWVAGAGGFFVADSADASIAGAMGLVASAVFAVALVFAPRYGLLRRAVRQIRSRRAGTRAPAPV